MTSERRCDECSERIMYRINAIDIGDGRLIHIGCSAARIAVLEQPCKACERVTTWAQAGLDACRSHPGTDTGMMHRGGVYSEVLKQLTGSDGSTGGNNKEKP